MKADAAGRVRIGLEAEWSSLPPGAPAAASQAGPTPAVATPGAAADAWSSIRQRLRGRGLRWTPQRRLLVEVLARTDGHVTGVELVERCRTLDPATTPSTVYRTLDVLEELGLVRHCHGADGREEFHVLPRAEHGHLYCAACGGTWEIGQEEAAGLVEALDSSRGFQVDLSHVTVVGRCAACRRSAAERTDLAAAGASGEPERLTGADAAPAFGPAP